MFADVDVTDNSSAKIIVHDVEVRGDTVVEAVQISEDDLRVWRQYFTAVLESTMRIWISIAGVCMIMRHKIRRTEQVLVLTGISHHATRHFIYQTSKCRNAFFRSRTIGTPLILRHGCSIWLYHQPVNDFRHLQRYT